MKKIILSNELQTLLILWGGNSYYPEEAPSYALSLGKKRRNLLDEEMSFLIKKKITANTMEEMTSQSIKSDVHAQDFLKAIYAYLFENGSEPDIDDYLTD